MKLSAVLNRLESLRRWRLRAQRLYAPLFCGNCGKFIKKTRKYHHRRYCSRSCANLHTGKSEMLKERMSTYNKLWNTVRKRKAPIQFICRTCKKHVHLPCRGNSRRRQYCSVVCSNRRARKTKNNRLLVTLP